MITRRRHGNPEVSCSFMTELCPVLNSGRVQPCLSLQANVVSGGEVVDGSHINCMLVL